jgi:hypothetical protein
MQARFVVNADIVDQQLLDRYRATAKPSTATLAMRLQATAGIASLVGGRE